MILSGGAMGCACCLCNATIEALCVCLVCLPYVSGLRVLPVQCNH